MAVNKNRETIFVSHERGFTLMEILVTIIIFGLLGTIASQSLFSLLRGASKSEAVKEVKQNGDYALSIMEVKIRNATISDAECTAAQSGKNSLIITNQDLTTTTFDCNSAAGRLQQEANNYLTNTSVTLNCVSEKIFTCLNINGNKKILINFTLHQAGVGLGVAESSAQTFQTQISLRNK